MKAFRLENLVKANPAVFDLVTREKRRFSEEADPLFEALDRFSQAHGGAVRFIAAGAGDGLTADPLRELIIRDDWRGVLVEPEPMLFRALRRNYPVRRFPNLRLVNAAVAPREDEGLLLFTVNPAALAPLPPEARPPIQALATLDHDRLLRLLPRLGLGPDAIVAIEAVPAVVERLAREFFHDRHFDLLIVDAGGHEGAILNSLDLDRIRPDGILYREDGIEAVKPALARKLVQAGYALRNVGPMGFGVRI